MRGKASGIALILAIIAIIVMAVIGIDLSQISEVFGVPPVAVTLPPLPGTVTPSAVFIEAEPYEIYFTEPFCPPGEERVGGVDEFIASDILNAQFSVEIATFDLDSPTMIDALIEAERRGLTVRFVTDDEHNPEPVTNRLRRNGISVVEDQRSALMHNKFVVIDERIVWMGSLNFTTNGVFCNNNVVVRWDSADLAENYLIELAEMYDDRAFGPTSPDNTTDRLVVGGLNVENYFAPETEVAPIIAREIARADEEVLFLAFSFTNSDIGEAIIERADAGLQVYGVFESIGSDAGSSYYNDFRRENLPNLQVLKDANPRIMHEKVIVLDGDTVIFGSFNFSDSANDSNDENIMIVRDETFATFFVDEFIRVWEEAGGE